MNNKHIQDFWNLVNDVEDFFSTGYRTSHPAFQIVPEKECIKGKEDFPEDKQLEFIKQKILNCKKCYLHYNRINAVPGEGVLFPDVFIVSEGPRDAEDKAGRPFVGEVEDYLAKWIDAIQLKLGENCFVCNIIRCRAPQNRDPRIEESRACLPYLDKQLIITHPKAILCLGRIPAQILTGKPTTSVMKVREQAFFYKGIPLVITYHPAYVLQDKKLRKPVWDDLKRLKRILNNRSGSS